MHACAAVKVDAKGTVTTVAKDCFTKPSEPCVWRGKLYVSDYASTTLTEVPLE
jgi:hypothetical protein